MDVPFLLYISAVKIMEYLFIILAGKKTKNGRLGYMIRYTPLLERIRIVWQLKLIINVYMLY